MCAVKAKLALLLALASAAALLLPCMSSAPPPPEDFYYAYAMKGKLVGYVRVTVTPGDANHPRIIESSLNAKIRLLGFDYDIHRTEKYRVDPQTNRIVHYDGTATAGPVASGTTVIVNDRVARYLSRGDGRTSTVHLSSDVLFHDPYYRHYLARDMPESGMTETYRFLSVDDGSLHKLRVTRTGLEDVDLAGRRRCAVFEMFDETALEKTVIWIDPGSSRWLKMALPDGSTLSLADAGIVRKAERAIVDDMILTDVDVDIPNYREIASMRILVKIRVSGESVTAASLNVAGQRFRGSVRDGIVEGVFDTRWLPHNDRAGAPFPANFDSSSSLRRYLVPEPGIESADPDIRSLSRHITRGSTDTLQAAQRLAGWVAREIRPFAIGGTALQTLKSRQGACQSYASLLAALCRSVGIPARLVYGCMYLPRGGRGVFGGHIWTEIYVGEAGWIAVDANHGEADVLDSGHIRLGSRAIAVPLEAQVLEHTLRARR
jgi:hypothetical protein